MNVLFLYVTPATKPAMSSTQAFVFVVVHCLLKSSFQLYWNKSSFIILQTQITDLMKTKSSIIDFAQWKQICFMPVLLLTRGQCRFSTSTEMAEEERNSTSFQLSQRHSVLGLWEENKANYTEVNTIFTVIA